MTMPGSIIDSARIDGCMDMGILLRIILPLSKSALVTLIVVNTLWVWNELLIAIIFLQKPTLRTLMGGPDPVSRALPDQSTGDHAGSVCVDPADHGHLLVRAEVLRKRHDRRGHQGRVTLARI